MTATAGSGVGAGPGAPAAVDGEPTPLAEYLGSVLRRVRALPPLDLDLAEAYANGLLVLGERVTTAAAGSTVDVRLLDRRR